MATIMEATPAFDLQSLITEIDDVFARLQSTEKMGEYVKFDAVADLILDIRQKASRLN